MNLLAALAADAVVWLHLGFILFVVAGAVLLWRWPSLVFLHVPAVLWGAWIEFSGRVCPLTPLENHLRSWAGEQGYQGGFVEHYLLPLIYPAQLTSEVQLLLGALVVMLNALLYALWLARCPRAPRLLHRLLTHRQERKACSSSKKRMS